MSHKINIDPDQLAELSKTHTRKQIAQIFGCSLSAIATRLNRVKPKQPKAIEKPKRKYFTPKVREMLLENCL